MKQFTGGCCFGNFRFAPKVFRDDYAIHDPRQRQDPLQR